MKLFVFASAGAAAFTYIKWGKYLDEIEVVPMDLAGRGSRSSEPFYPNFEVLIQDVYAQLLEQSEGEPFALMGHSFGCDIAYELIQRLQREQQRMPEHLFAFGNTPPFSVKARMKFSHLPDEAFVKAMEFFGGIDPVLYQFPDVLKYFSNIMRADMRLVEQYEDNPKLRPEAPWQLPLSVFCGKDDHTFDHQDLTDWEQCSDGPCDYYMLEGGHFFLEDNVEAITSVINQTLNRTMISRTRNGKGTNHGYDKE